MPAMERSVLRSRSIAIRDLVFALPAAGGRDLVLGLGVVIGLAAFATGAVAQTLPGPVEPGQIEKRFEGLPEPRALPELSVPLPEGRRLDASAAEKVIPLAAVELSGNTAIATEELAPFWQPLLGEKVSLAQLADLAQRITAHYRNAGYILTRIVIPEQRVTDGIVQLRVIESYIGKYEIAGQLPTDGEALLKVWLERIKASRPLHIQVLEHYLLLADGLPGLKVQGRVAAAPGGDPGASVLTLLVEQDPWDVALQIDNHGSESIGPNQLFVSASRYGLLDPYDATSISFSTAAETDELRYLALSHERLSADDGTRLRIALVSVESEPGDSLAQLAIKTRTRSVDLGFTHPLAYRRGARSDVYGGFSWREFRSEVLGSRLSADDLRVMHLGVRTDFADRFAGVTLVDAAFHYGLKAFGATAADDANRSRADASGNFSKMTLQVAHVQPIEKAWSLYGVANAQAAFAKLLASEEFSYGGSAVGRAYDPSELTGDHGISALLELRHDSDLTDLPLKRLQPFAFYDVGTVWQEGADRESGASAGLGMRLFFDGEVQAGAYWAKPLTRPSAEGDDGRLFFELRAQF